MARNPKRPPSGLRQRDLCQRTCAAVNERPWYHAGLRFQCTECGDCCGGAPGYVWLNKEEIKAIAAKIGEPDVDTFEDMYVRKIGIRKSLREFPNGDCVFFDTESRGCAVYDVRPRQCRTWPFWDSNLKTLDAWEQTCDACPGSGKGRLLDLEEIETLRRTLRV